MRILYIDIDSLRPSHLGCYGYHRRTSPNIDRLAREGCVMTGVYATDSPCLPSRTALATGRFGTRTGVVNHGGLCADLAPEGRSRGFRSRIAQSTLGAALTQCGLHTASISPFPRRHSAYQMTWGFRETFDTGQGGLENADDIYAPASDWLRRNGERDDWFLHVNFWDPHTPYDTPESFGNPFRDEPIDPWLTQEIIDRQRASYGPHSAREVPNFDDVLPERWRWGVGEIRSLEDAKVHIDGYDTGVLYADEYVGRLMNDLADLGVLDETAIVVSADHGENLGELNVWGDHQTADEHTNHIPCVVRWPGVSLDGHVNEGLHYHLDMGATMVALSSDRGPQVLEGLGWDGESFADELRGGEGGRSELFLSQGAWSCQRSVRWGDHLLIRTYHTGLKEFEEYMLFDIRDDLHETRNLAASQPEVVAEGSARIDQAFGAMAAESPHGDPFEVVVREGGPYHANEQSEEWARYLTRLDGSGRSHHADFLRSNGGRPKSVGSLGW